MKLDQNELKDMVIRKGTCLAEPSRHPTGGSVRT